MYILTTLLPPPPTPICSLFHSYPRLSYVSIIYACIFVYIYICVSCYCYIGIVWLFCY